MLKQRGAKTCATCAERDDNASLEALVVLSIKILSECMDSSLVLGMTKKCLE